MKGNAGAQSWSELEWLRNVVDILLTPAALLQLVLPVLLAARAVR